MSTRIFILGIGVVLLILVSALAGIPQTANAQNPLNNEITFTGRRGTSYTAAWDAANYSITFDTPDSTFPWDWIGFTGQHGAVALSGLPNLENTLDRSSPGAILGTMPGDLWRIKGSGVVSLAHLTKIGLVIGNGPGAQRAWFSDGIITEYVMAPHYIGYRVQLLGRTADVKLTSLNPQDYHAVIAIEITLDDPTNAHLVLASDLEPAMDYSVAVTIHDRTTQQINYNPTTQAISAVRGSVTTFAYADQPLQSWSGNNLALDDYLAADTLDGQLVAGSSDARAALRIAAQNTQYFYIGSLVLDHATRSDPTTAWYTLRDARIQALNAMPQIESVAQPKFEFVNFLSNLGLTYLLNPNGGLHYADKAFLYLPDTLIPLVVAPHLLPPRIQAAFHDGLSIIAAQQHAGNINSNYSYKLDSNGWAPLPDWYGGNFPDIIHYDTGGGRVGRENFSDVYATAEFINAVHQYYLVTGDAAYAQSFEHTIIDAVDGLKAFDAIYDDDFGPEDGNLFPNVLVPMGDLGLIAGEYPSEAAQAIYAYEDAADLLRLYNRDTDADALIDDFVTPMRAAYDNYFWDAASNFYMGIADQRSQTRPAGTQYNDWWVNLALIPLYGDIGRNHLPEILATLTAPNFYEPSHDIHWLSRRSESFVTPGRWGVSVNYTNGWAMEGAYLLLPNAIIPIGYYKLDQSNLAATYANHYFDKFTSYGPYEVIHEYAGSMPGSMYEASLYIEPLAATLWLLQSALNIEVDGLDVSITPRIAGQFRAENVHLTTLGLTAVLNYERDALGDEYITIVSNEGLNINAPNAQARYAIRWGSYDDAGSSTYGFYTNDHVTPLASDHLAQLIWTGPNGIIDPPGCDGLPGNDDLLLDENRIHNGDPLPMTAQERGYLPWKVYTYDPAAAQNGGEVYIRAWDAPTPLAATAYLETTTATLETASLFNAPRSYADQSQSVWVGPANGDWHTPAHWNSAAYPDSTTRAVIPGGTSVQLGNDAAAREICIARAAVLDLVAHQLSVENHLANFGSLKQTAAIDATCSTSAPCRFLHIQNMAGNQSFYHGVDIAQTGSMDLETTTVTIRGGQACGASAGFSATVQRCYDITPAEPQESTITFYYTAAEANGNTAPEVWHYDGSVWQTENFEARGENGSVFFVRANGIDAYSPFALATDTPTAISLLDFKAQTGQYTNIILAGLGLLLSIALIIFGRLSTIKKRNPTH